jgi:crossover junction endodeoxyribonuclease RuvC
LRIIGIDPGLRHTGWGIIDIIDNKLTYVADGRVSAPVSLSDGNRLFFIKNELALVVIKYQPSFSAVEQIFVGAGSGSSLKLGMARGVALLVLAEAKLITKELPPRLVKKKNITGTGTASKDQINSMVRRLLNIIPKNEDSSDALAIAISAQNLDYSISNNTLAKNNGLELAIAKALLKEKNI